MGIRAWRSSLLPFVCGCPAFVELERAAPGLVELPGAVCEWGRVEDGA